MPFWRTKRVRQLNDREKSPPISRFLIPSSFALATTFASAVLIVANRQVLTGPRRHFFGRPHFDFTPLAWAAFGASCGGAAWDIHPGHLPAVFVSHNSTLTQWSKHQTDDQEQQVQTRSQTSKSKPAALSSFKDHPFRDDHRQGVTPVKEKALTSGLAQ